MEKHILSQELKKQNEEKLREEKKQALKYFANLECKKEQLNILIDKLNSLSNGREGLNNSGQGNSKITKCLNNLGNYACTITSQLIQAKQQQQQIKKELDSVINQLKNIDTNLKKR